MAQPDTTSEVTYSYDRRGRRATVVQGQGARQITTTLANNDAAPPLTMSYAGGTLAGLSVNRAHDQCLRLQSAQAKNGAK